MKLTSFFNLTLHSLCHPISLSCPLICFSSSNFLKFLSMCSLYGFSFPANSPGLISQTRSPTTPLYFHLLAHFYRDHLFPFHTCSQILSRSHPNIPLSQQSFFLSSIPLFFFHHSSLGEQIASSVLCSWRTAGNNGRVGLVVVATGMRQEKEGGWGRQRRKAA